MRPRERELWLGDLRARFLDVARKRVPAEAVEDVVQEALITVHKARHTYDPARPFGPWFYAIVHSRLIDVLR